MKTLVYSKYTKAIAALLFIAAVVLGALTVTNGVAEYFGEEKQIYRFEIDFREASYLTALLDEPESAVANAYYNYYYENDIPLDREVVLEEAAEIIEQNIEKRLDYLYCADLIDYYVKWNDRVFTNCGATSEQELRQAQFYRYTSRDENGDTRMGSSQNRYFLYPLMENVFEFDKTSEIVVCTSIKAAYAAECQEIWERQEALVTETFTIASGCIAAALLLLIYLICVCGRNKNGEHRAMWLDNVWLEVHLAAIGGIGIGAAALCVIVIDEYLTGHFPYSLMYIVVGLSAFIASAVVLASLLSIIRNIKCRRFVESGLIFRIVRCLWRAFAAAVMWIAAKARSFKRYIFAALSKKTGCILIGMLFAYTALIGIFGIGIPYSPIWLIFGILLFALASFVIAYRAKDLDEVKKGVSEVRNGNIAYKIPELKSEDMRLLASNVNDIAKGLDESVSAKLKAERLKTELITNVSHDLKTPLTSIINYTELLSGVEGLSEEARDYVRIIANKSDRLKTLTQDLFDISKVQSGNESVVFEKIDVALLLSQSLGEHDNEIQNSELPFCVNLQKELYISADGRKLSRVIGNLINNILKYTLKNTRVFISAYEENDEVVMEFKNIASYPMDFRADEIVGRFVRGDASRTAEGNGLGLAIAKSYTEICGGSFEIIIDGDMFKAILRFRKAL